MPEQPIRRVQLLAAPAASFGATFGLMDERLRVESNDRRVLDAAAASFGRFALPSGNRPPLLLRLFSEETPGQPMDAGPTGGSGSRDHGTARSAPGPDPRLVFRMAGSTFLISRGETDIAAVDVVNGHATGFVGAATAADTAVLRYTFLEAMALSMLSRARGYLAVHAATVVRGGIGLVLHGPAGAGKSTLALACARRGFGVLSEDAAFLRPDPAGATLWGMPWRQRLLPDAVALFPELAGLEVRPQPNGERKLELDLDDLLPGCAVPRAPLGAVIHVARGTGGGTRLEPVEAARPGDAIELPWPFDDGWAQVHDAAVDALRAVPWFRLHVNGTPDEAVDALNARFGGADQAAAHGGGE